MPLFLDGVDCSRGWEDPKCRYQLALENESSAPSLPSAGDIMEDIVVKNPQKFQPLYSRDSWLRLCARKFGENMSGVCDFVYHQLEKFDNNPSDGFFDVASVSAEEIGQMFNHVESTNDGEIGALGEMQKKFSIYREHWLDVLYATEYNNQLVGIDENGNVAAFNGLMTSYRALKERYPDTEAVRLIIDRQTSRGRQTDHLNPDRAGTLRPILYEADPRVTGGLGVFHSDDVIEALPYSTKVNMAGLFMPEGVDTIMGLAAMAIAIAALYGGKRGIGGPMPGHITMGYAPAYAGAIPGGSASSIHPPTNSLPADVIRTIRRAMTKEGKNMPTIYLAEGRGGKENRPPKSVAIVMNSRYHDGLVEFKKRCTDYKSIEDFLTSAVEKDVGGLGTFVSSKTDQVHVVDIGYGNGVITSHLAGLLMRNGRVPIIMELLEPTGEYVDMATGRLERLINQGLSIRFIQQKAEKHFGPSTDGRYDLVFASHTMHLVPLEYISAVASSVRPGGYMIVVIGARSSIMSDLKDLFVSVPAITGKDILETTASLELPFEVTVVQQPSFLDLRGAALPQSKSELTEPVKNLFSLMIQKNIDDISQTDYENVRNMIIVRLDSNGILRLENDCLIFKRPD